MPTTSMHNTATRDTATADPARATGEQAWQWLLALRDAPVAAGSRAVALGPETHPTLTVSAEGSWHCTAPVSAAASRMLDLYAPVCAPPAQSFIVAQMGQSLDGRIATHCGVSHYINGDDGLVHLHRLRALVDAVVVGSGTAAADNPRLNVRHVPGPNPVRVVLDRHRRVPASHQLFSDGRAPTLRFVDPSCGGSEHRADNVETVLVAMDQPDAKSITSEQAASGAPADATVSAVLSALADRGLTRVLIEGGGQTVSRFLAAGALDRLHVIVAPMIIGSGLPAFTLPPMDTLEHALRPANRRFDLGSDLLFDLQPKHHP